MTTILNAFKIPTYSCQKNYLKVNSFRISDCAKNVMDYTIIKCHNRISEVEKVQTRPRFLISQYPNMYTVITLVHIGKKIQWSVFQL
jgi:hypothetical protein